MKQKSVKFPFLLLPLLLLVQQGKAQKQQLGGSQSPTQVAASTGSAMSGIYSPSLYDGTVNVNIPIYQYNADGLDLGISLGYNTRGIKVDQLSSELGLGWTLNAAPVIRRVVKDLPDEIHGIMDDVIDASEGNYSNIRVNPERVMRGKLAVYRQTPAQALEGLVYRDGESDDFIVSLGGSSFTFNIGAGDVMYTMPKRNVKIELLHNGSPITSIPAASSAYLYTMEFVITDEQGNRFYFTGGDYADREVTDKFGYGYRIGTYKFYTSWVITKVVLASGSEVRYNYGPMVNTKPSGRPSSVREALISSYPPSIPPAAQIALGVYLSRLSSINYPNDVTATIVYDIQSRKDNWDHAIKEIKISSGVNSLRYKMDQAYFGSWDRSMSGNSYPSEIAYNYVSPPGLNFSDYRLKLKGIRLANGSLEEPYYSFEYNPTQLPPRYQYRQDHYGYYNDGPAVRWSPSTPEDETTTIPYHLRFWSGTGYYWGNNKTPKIDSMKMGILTKINNAYGGTVAFEYEGHSLTNIVSSRIAGFPASDELLIAKNAADGLRVKSITESDKHHIEQKLITTFVYSGGQLFLSGGYYHYPSRQSGVNKDIIEYIFNGSSLTALHLVGGANHGYSEVSAESRNHTGELLSRKEISFSNLYDAATNNFRYMLCGNGSKNYFTFPYTDKQYLRDWEMGLPLSIKEYDQNGMIVTETRNYYRSVLDTTTSQGLITNRKVSSIHWQYPEGTFTTNDIFDNYRPYRGKSFLDSTSIFKYTSNTTYIADRVKYGYDSKDNLTSIVATNSKGEELHTLNYYNYALNYDKIGGYVYPILLPGLEKILSIQRWKRPAGSVVSMQPTNGSLIDAHFNSYNYSNGANGLPEKIWSRRLYNLVQGTQPILYTSYFIGGIYASAFRANQANTGNSLPDFKKTSEVSLFDAKGNPLETYMPEQNVYKAMIWDTISGQKTAEAISCRYADIAYTSFERTTPGPLGNSIIVDGNITYNTFQAVNGPGGNISGNRCARVSGGFAENQIGGTRYLTPGMTYTLSFWAYGGKPTILPTPISYPDEPVYEVNGWKNYQVKIVGGVNTLFSIRLPVVGSTLYLDDIRLYPENAVMESWTYEPLFGKNSATDITGRVSTFKYDALGRLVLVYDQEGKILTKTEYRLR